MKSAPILCALLLMCIGIVPLWAQVPAPEPEESSNDIRVVDAPLDEAIQSRIESVLAAIADLDTVEVQVSAGVVTLSGEAPSARVARELVALADRVEGVVFVQNRLLEEADIGARMRPATQRFRELGNSLLRLLPVLLVALTAVVLFWLLGKWAGNRGAWLQRLGLTDLGSHLGTRIIRLLVTAIGILIALEILDATALVGALLGVAGVAGIAIGFAFRNIVENYLAGVLLSIRNPFKIGDFIRIGEFEGNVIRLTSRDTVLMTMEGNHLRIPNSLIITSALTNFSRNPLRRFEFRVGVSVDFDLLQARDLGIDTLQKVPGILSDPPPQVLIWELGDSTVQLLFLAWINQRDTDFMKARSAAIRMIKCRFDEAGIEMPEPIYRIHLRDNGESGIPHTTAERTKQRRTSKGAAADPQPLDVAADHSLDQQMAAELRNSDEENLLTDK